MHIRGIFAFPHAGATTFVLTPDAIRVHEIAEVDACAPTDATAHAAHHVLPHLGPFFTCDGQLAAYCATAFCHIPDA